MATTTGNTMGLNNPNEDDQMNSNNELQGENDITPGEKALLDNAGVREDEDDDDEILASAQLDNTDEDGVTLNQHLDVSGEDLDVPGSEADDANEAIGEEDEENNSYSLRDQEDASNG